MFLDWCALVCLFFAFLEKTKCASQENNMVFAVISLCASAD